MADQTAHAMEALDSRNASIKRAHEGDDVDSSKPAPRKRAKRGGRPKQVNHSISQTAPSGNWNAGTKSAIRTSLGKSDNEISGQLCYT